MLQNRGDDEQHLNFAERSANEKYFFASGNYRHMPQDMMGIDHLTAKLSTIFYEHLRNELPALKKELDALAEMTQRDLSLLGDKRSTPEQRKDYLANVYTEARELLSYGTQGHYAHEFFHNLNLDGPALSKLNVRRFPAVVQHLNLNFSRVLEKKPSVHSFPKSPSQTKNDVADDPSINVDEDHLEEMDKPVSLSREEAVQWVCKIIQQSRSLELPGVFSHHVIGHLFREQSCKWEKLARTHVDCVADACQSFVHQILDNVAAPEVKTQLLAHTVDNPLKRHPITYNHYFTDTLQRIQRDKFNHEINQRIAAATQEVNVRKEGYQSWINPTKLSIGAGAFTERDMDKFSADQALDTQTAYYKDERKYFVNVITKQVIERHLISTLPSLLHS